MHNWGKSIMECVKSKIDAMGMDNLGREDVEELKMWTCIAKDIAEYDYYYHITEAMEKPENQYGVNYDENGKYYTPPRSSNGQFRQDMRRRGYDEMYDRSPMYYRDMDMNEGKMYYTESSEMNSMRGSNSSGMNGRGYSESGYERARRGYEEAKMADPNTDYTEEMKEMFRNLEEEMKELKPHMTATEKNTARNKLTNIANTMM